MSSLTVVSVDVRYLAPLKYGDQINIEVQLRTQGVRIFIQYKLFNQDRKLCATGQSIHCSVDKNLKLIRLDEKLVKKIKETSWIETWL